MEKAEKIRLLEEKVDSLLKEENAALKLENTALKIENEKLKEQLKVSSSNSSLPPSRDWKKNKKNDQSKPPAKPAGGKPGHKGHHRDLLPAEQVDRIQVEKLPERCLCGGLLLAEDEFIRHQVHDLPPLKLEVTEYQLQKGQCSACKKKQSAKPKEGMSLGLLGPKLTALMVQMVSEYGLSRRELQRFLETHFNFSASLGLIFKQEVRCTRGFELEVEELLTQVRHDPVKHSDETGHRHQGNNFWSWIFMSKKAAVIQIHPSRGRKVFNALQGGSAGIVVSDRYGVYDALDPGNRQLCWAHLKRDFKRFSMREDPLVSRIGAILQEQQLELFYAWHGFQNCLITTGEWAEAAELIAQKMERTLIMGSLTDPSLKLSGFCKRLLKAFDALWTFTLRDDVPPTNNQAERGLRHLVIWRKKYLSTKSDIGLAFVARTQSLLITARLQKVSYFDRLYASIKTTLYHPPWQSKFSPATI